MCGCLCIGGATAQTLRIYLVGDSTCATKKLDKQNPERGWGHMFQPLFDTCVVVENHATNGRSTKSFRAEGRWDKVFDRLREGDYVFIQFGHNDRKINDSTRYSPPGEYAENLRRYVREVRSKGAVPILLTPIVRRCFVDGVLTDTHADYPDAVRRVAGQECVTLLDMESLTRDWVSSLGDELSKRYYMWVDEGCCPLYPEGRSDDTHLNVRGARVVARMIAGLLRDRVPALGAHLLPEADFVVAKDGAGDFFTVAEAVAAIPDFCRDTTRITVCAGRYREKIAIPATKRHVVFAGRGDACVTWDDCAAGIGATGRPLGTSGSATIYFGGDHWRVEGMTFENSAGRVGQAVAVQCLGTDIRFFRCRFVGDQDTLYLYGAGNRDELTATDNAWYLFDGCRIEGTADFIFGSAAALFRNCEIRSKADSYITAASTCRGQACGLVFVGCRLTADEGVTRCFLGRPWRDYACTVFVGCDLGAHILPEGWHDWDRPRTHRTARYGEYGSTGAGAGQTGRVSWARRLTRREAEKLVAECEKQLRIR